MKGEKRRKTVSFACEKDLVNIYYYPDEEDRKSDWMQMAVDRARFKRRIQQTEELIGWIFGSTK